MLEKNFEQIELELKKVVDQKEEVKRKFLDFFLEKNFLEKCKKLSTDDTKQIACGVFEEFKKIDNPSTIQKNVSQFKDYRLSYLNSVLLIRNEMINNNEYNLVYSYLFLISHYIELVIKAVLLHKNEGIKSTHCIKSLFLNNKDYLLKIGLELNYFEYCLEEFEKLKKYTVTEDFSMCFRYPLDRKFDKKIITEDLINISADELNKMVKQHKNLMIILELLIQLSEKFFYEEVYQFLIKLDKEFEIATNK